MERIVVRKEDDEEIEARLPRVSAPDAWAPYLQWVWTANGWQLAWVWVPLWRIR